MKKQKLSTRLLKFFITTLCLVVAVKMMSSGTANEKDIEKEIRVTCIVEIKKKLKYPSSMEIVHRSVVPAGENEWVAEIGIKAKNDFGVMVPSNFICNVYLEDGKYKLKKIRNY